MIAFLSSFSRRRPIATGAATLAVFQLAASVAGLVRDRVLSAAFPPGADHLDVVSVYIAAFRPSDLLFQVFIMSAFSVALVPLLASHLAHDRKGDMHHLLSSAITVAAAVFGVLALIAVVFFHRLAPFFVDFTGERLELYVTFGRLALLTNFLFVFGNACGQYLITRQVYITYGLTLVLYTVGTICGALFLAPAIGPYGPMFGTILGAAVYVALRALAVKRDGFTFSLASPASRAVALHPDLVPMFWLMLPRMCALGAVQLQLLFFDKVASGLPLGSVTINAFARNFQAAGVGIIGIALAQSVFSLLSQDYARSDTPSFWKHFHKGALLSLLLSVCATASLITLTPVAAWLVHLTDTEVYAAFSGVLIIYACSIPFESFNHLLYRAIYATKHTALPAAIGVGGGIVSIGTAWWLGTTLGVRALGWGFLIGQVVMMIGLISALLLRLRAAYGVIEKK